MKYATTLIVRILAILFIVLVCVYTIGEKSDYSNSSPQNLTYKRVEWIPQELVLHHNYSAYSVLYISRHDIHRVAGSMYSMYTELDNVKWYITANDTSSINTIINTYDAEWISSDLMDGIIMPIGNASLVIIADSTGSIRLRGEFIQAEHQARLMLIGLSGKHINPFVPELNESIKNNMINLYQSNINASRFTGWRCIYAGDYISRCGALEWIEIKAYEAISDNKMLLLLSPRLMSSTDQYNIKTIMGSHVEVVSIDSSMTEIIDAVQLAGNLPYLYLQVDVSKDYKVIGISP